MGEQETGGVGGARSQSAGMWGNGGVGKCWDEENCWQGCSIYTPGEGREGKSGQKGARRPILKGASPLLRNLHLQAWVAPLEGFMQGCDLEVSECGWRLEGFQSILWHQMWAQSNPDEHYCRRKWWEAFTVGMGREAGIGRLRDWELHGLVDFRARGVPWGRVRHQGGYHHFSPEGLARCS